jgi:citrate synthase
MCAGVFGAIIGPRTQDMISTVYLVALTWQDLIAGLLAGAAALWAASIAYRGAMEAAAIQAEEAKRNTEELILQADHQR